MKKDNRSLLYKVVVGLVILGGMALVASACHSDDGAEEVDQSTPEVTVRAMYRALEQADAQLMERLVAPSDPSRKMAADAVRRMKASGVTFEQTDVEIYIISNDGQTALVSTTGHSQLRKGNEIIWDDDGEGSEDLTLTHLDGKWYLVGLGQWPSPGWVKP